MNRYRDAQLEGRIESWGSVEIRTEVGFCSRCEHPLVAGVCISCGRAHCPICGAAAGCDHALPGIERRETPVRPTDEEDDEGEFYEEDEFDDEDDPDDPDEHDDTPIGLSFPMMHRAVRWHGNWTEGVPEPFGDDGILYELIHDGRLRSRLEEEVWTRAARSAGKGLVAVERLPLGALSRPLPRERRWFTHDRDAVLEAGRALEESWTRRLADVEEVVRSRVRYLECPLCGTATYHTYEDGLLSCGECGAWECPYCGVNDVECGSGCPHSLGLVVEGTLYDSEVDLSAIPFSGLSWEQSTEIDQARTEEVFGDLFPVLDVYDYCPMSRPNRAYLMLALVEHACPDVHVEIFSSPHGSLTVPLCRDIELGKRQFEAALARLADAMRRFDALAPSTPREIEEEN